VDPLNGKEVRRMNLISRVDPDEDEHEDEGGM
jgi:hypothetical protein